MKKAIDLLIFDQDGTLVDSRKDITNSVNFALEVLGLPLLDIKTVAGYVGEGVTKLIERALGPNSELRDKARSLFLEYYSGHLIDNTYLYPNVVDVLEYFSTKKKAVISNKLEALAKGVLKGLGILHHFDIVLGGDSTDRRKPFPDPIIKVLNTLDIKASRTLMIGDGSTDIESGKKAGALTCGVSYGYRERNEILKSKPDFMIDSLLELKEIIE